jgi:hypothetical protein
MKRPRTLADCFLAVAVASFAYSEGPGTKKQRQVDEQMGWFHLLLWAQRKQA